MLVAEDGEEFEFAGSFGAWGRGEDEQHLRVVLGEQGLAVDLDRTEFRVEEGLVVLEPAAHLVRLPEGGELRALATQLADEFSGARAGAHRAEGGAQRGDLGAALPIAVVLGVASALRLGMDEPPVDLAALQPRSRD